MNRHEYVLGGLCCEHCGKVEEADYDVEDRRNNGDACHGCLFWLRYMEEDAKLPHVLFVTESFNHYADGGNSPGSKSNELGFAGAVAEITFPDGEVVMTNNLWSQGKVPEHFREKWPVKPSKLEWKG